MQYSVHSVDGRGWVRLHCDSLLCCGCEKEAISKLVLFFNLFIRTVFPGRYNKHFVYQCGEGEFVGGYMLISSFAALHNQLPFINSLIKELGHGGFI